MKNSFKTLLALAAFGATALITQAQTAPKVFVLDMRKAVENHYKKAIMEASLNAEGQQAQTKLQAMEKEVQEVAKKMQELEEQGKNPAITNDAKAKLAADYEKLGQEGQAKQGELQNFYNSVRREFAEKQQNGLAGLVDDISKKASEIVKRKGGDLLLTKDTIVYFNPSWEITDEVILEINKDKPAGAPAAAKPAAPAAKPAAPAAAPAAPAAEGAPSIVFPGAKK